MNISDPIGFLKYGPIGFAGLMLCLTVVALTAGNLDQNKTTIIKLFLYVGAFCFTLSSVLLFLPQYIGAPHLLHLRIDPTKMSPPPLVTMNNTTIEPPLNYVINSETTAIIDMTAAMDALRISENRNATQTIALNSVAHATDESLAKINNLNNLVSSSGCPGGAHGIPIPNGANISNLSNMIKTDLLSVKNKTSEFLN